MIGTGTLLWIGPRDIPEFHSIYEFCEQRVAQIAFRPDLESAIARPAGDVTCVLIAKCDQSHVDQVTLESLKRSNQCQNIWTVLGPLCAGERGAHMLDNRIYWHQWHQFFAAILGPCYVTEQDTEVKSLKSVVVIAESAFAADPLLDLAGSVSATAVWCRTADAARAKNFDVVWWDDSIATPTSAQIWSRRIASQNQVCPSATHVWLTNSWSHQQIRAAEQAGMDLVLTKPALAESLLSTLDVNSTVTMAWYTELSRAA